MRKLFAAIAFLCCAASQIAAHAQEELVVEAVLKPTRRDLRVDIIRRGPLLPSVVRLSVYDERGSFVFYYRDRRPLLRTAALIKALEPAWRRDAQLLLLIRQLEQAGGIAPGRQAVRRMGT